MGAGIHKTAKCATQCGHLSYRTVMRQGEAIKENTTRGQLENYLGKLPSQVWTLDRAISHSIQGNTGDTARTPHWKDPEHHSFEIYQTSQSPTAI